MSSSGGSSSLWLSLAIAIVAGLIYYPLLGYLSGDAELWFVPWLQHIIDQGPIDSLAKAMPVTVEAANGRGNYAPTYLYLLIVGSALHDYLSPILILKLVSIAGSLLCAAMLYGLLRVLTSLDRARIGAAAMLLLPTVILNAAVWGQSDAYYAGFVVLTIMLIFRDRWLAAMLAFGLAVSFKLQAAIIGPFLLYAMISRRGPFWTFLLVPCVYVALMLPAWLAGRPASELVSVYLDQANTWHWLSMNAPNPWSFVQRLGLVSYEVGAPLGLAVAGLAGLGLSALGFRRRLEGADLLLFAVATAAIMPYLLPKMHDRYFFLADVLAYALFVVRPSRPTLLIALAIQLGSLAAYLHSLFGFPIGPYVGTLSVSVAIVLLAMELFRLFAVQPASPLPAARPLGLPPEA